MRLVWELFWSFLKIGAFTFGAGYAMIPMIEREVVEKKKWFDRDDFYNRFTLAQSAPGPFSLNTAVFVGYKVRGVPGALASVIGAVLPSFLIILLIAVYLDGYHSNPVVEAAFKGIRPAVVAMIAVPFIRMLMRLDWYFKVAAVAVVCVVCFTGISPVYLLLGAAVAGIIVTLYGK